MCRKRHRSDASEEQTPIPRRPARVSLTTDRAAVGATAGLIRNVTVHAAILEAISTLRGMFAPHLLEARASEWYSRDRWTATGQPDRGTTQQAGVGICLP